MSKSQTRDCDCSTLLIGGVPVIDVDRTLTVTGLTLQGNIASDVCLDAGHVVKIGGTQVVQGQLPPIPNASGATTVILRCNAILDALRTHGLITTSL